MAGGLKRGIGTVTAVFYGVGVMLGAGIYVVIGEAAALSGNALWLSFMIAAVVALFTGLSYAELASAFPRSASEYFYAKRAFGETWAFLSGWMILFTNVLATATVALGFASYFTAITGAPPVAAAAALVLCASGLAFLGIRESAAFNVVFTLVEVAGLLIVIAIGAGRFGSVNYLELPPQAGLGGVLGGAALIFFAFIGFNEIVNLADQTRDPARVLPRALLASVLLTTVLYVLVGLAVVSLVPWPELAASDAPLAHVVSGALPAWLFSVIPLFATANTVLILVIVNSLVLHGMARDNALPNALGRAHRGRHTPHVAIAATCAVVLLFVLPGDLGRAAALTDVGVLMLYGLVNLAHVQLRRAEPGLPRPFRAPLSLGRQSLTPVIGLFTCAGLVALFEPPLLAIYAAVMLGGYAYYRAYRRLVIDRGRWRPSGVSERVHIRRVIEEEREG